MKILKISNKNFKKIIGELIKAIKSGKVIVCPTDTVYGLITDATNKRAVTEIFEIKGRSIKKPFPIFVRNLIMAKKIAKINKRQEIFLTPHQNLRFGTGQGKVWPGRVTVIFEKKKGQKLYGVGKRTIGLRIPNYKLVNIFLGKLNRPLVGTSANISGKPPSTRIKDVISQFKDKKNQPDLIVDAGNLPKSRPSTVIDLSGDKPKVLRK